MDRWIAERLYRRNLVVEISTPATQPESPAGPELDRLRAENARLKSAVAALEDLIAIAPAFFGTLSPEGVILDLNDLAVRVIERKREQVVGRRFWEQPWWSPIPASAARIREAVADAADGRASVFDIEYCAFEDGASARRWVAFSMTPLYDEAGRISRMAATGIDVTERRQTQEALAEANSSKDEFLAMLGHELRNPLAPITTALQLMKLRSGDEVAKERTVIERQVEHLMRLVDDLLDVSRITRGKIDLRLQRLELSGVVANAIEIASPLLEQRRHHLKIEVPSSGLAVDGDPVRLTQVVSNLLTNAAKYTDPGGHIAVRGAREGGEVVLRVNDDGFGISPQMLPRVFDLFAQERQTIDRARGGLGLGLAIVRTLVKAHGGTVSVDSAGPGQGSEFTIRLPAVPAAEDARPRHTQTTAQPSSGADRRRILIVDDNTDAAELLGELLDLMGHETRVAFDGPSALEIVRTFQPDIAVLDIGLPVMDGYELARRLRELPSLQRTRLVALTGYGQLSDRHGSAAAGFNAHLVKPIEIALLEALIASNDRSV